MERFRFDKVDSTHLEARRRFRGEALVVVASEQSAGMGRLGRTWVSPPGGLWLTLAWPMRRSLEDYQALPLAAGLAAAQAIEGTCAVRALLKWPNDVLVERGGRWRKLCGILCQAELDLSAILVGVGINANLSVVDLGDGLRHPPTSLRDELGQDVDLAALEHALTLELLSVLGAYEGGRWSTHVLPAIRPRLCWVGQQVICRDVQGTVLACGAMQGVDANGRLLVDEDGQSRALSVGEVTLVEVSPISSDQESGGGTKEI